MSEPWEKNQVSVTSEAHRERLDNAVQMGDGGEAHRAVKCIQLPLCQRPQRVLLQCWTCRAIPPTSPIPKQKLQSSQLPHTLCTQRNKEIVKRRPEQQSQEYRWQSHKRSKKYIQSSGVQCLDDQSTGLTARMHRFPVQIIEQTVNFLTSIRPCTVTQLK